MKIVIFGASGMVGQAVLREAIADDEVREILLVVRRPLHQASPKIREIVHLDLADLGPIASQLHDLDACFYCLGASAAGLDEAAYTRINHDLPLAAARTLHALAPDVVFVYVSGGGTGESSRMMWARVKGRTESELLALLPRAIMFRPGYIQPMDGIRSRTRLYNLAYALFGPLYPLLRRCFPAGVTSTRQVGRAMLHVAQHGARQRVLENRDINALPSV